MKGFKLLSYIFGLIGMVIASYWTMSDFSRYSDIVTFLSIVIGFEMTSLSILFGSPLKKVLYDRNNKLHGTELHRLKDYFRFSIMSCVVGVLIVILIPNFSIQVYCWYCPVNKGIFVLPVMYSAIYGFCVLFSELLHIFVYPTNE